jgi:hypothetical protein
VTAINAVGGASAESRSTDVVVRSANGFALAAPKNVEAPVLVGQMRVGHRLYAWSGVWAHDPTFFTWEWLRCWPGRRHDCEVIQGAYGPAYHPTAHDVGYVIVSVVTAWNAGGQGVAVAGSKNRSNVRFSPAPAG